MIWNKPRNVGQWLVLLSLAIVAIIVCQIVVWRMPPIPPLHFPDPTGDLANVQAQMARTFPIAFYLVVGLSFGLGYVFARGAAIQRMGNIIFLSLVIAILNGSVAFAGCAFRGFFLYFPR